MIIKEGTVLKINGRVIGNNFVGLYTNIQGNVPYRGPKNSEKHYSSGNRPVMFLKTTDNSYYFARFQGINNKDLYDGDKNCLNTNYLPNGGFCVMENGGLNGFFTKDSMLCLDYILKVDKKEFDTFCDTHNIAIEKSRINEKCFELINNDIKFSLEHNLPNIPIVEIHPDKLFKEPTKHNDKYFNNVGDVININPYLIDRENHIATQNNKDDLVYKTLNADEKEHIDNNKKWDIKSGLQNVLDDFGIKPNQNVLDFAKNSKENENFINDKNPNKLTKWFSKEKLIVENDELDYELKNDKILENSTNYENEIKIENEYKNKNAIGFDNANQQKEILNKKNEQLKNNDQKKVVEKENNKYRDALDKIDNKIDELQKNFENEINKLNLEKENLMKENKKLIDSVKNKDVKDKKLKEIVKENVNKLKNKDLTKSELKKEINKLKTKKEENTKKVAKPKESQSKTSKTLKKDGIVRKESKPLKSNKPKVDFVKFGNMRNNRMNQNPMMENKPKEKSRGGIELERTLFKK